jgi:Ca-activated chloride channel homolog
VNVQVDPLLPLPLIAAMVAVALGTVGARVRRHAPAAAVVRTIAMIVLAALVAVDPTVAGGSSEARRAAADVLFVVDSTSSMAALDFDGDQPRLDGVRTDVMELAAEFPGAHFSLLRFDSQARVELPWTTDFAALETAVSLLRQERAVYSSGSQLDLPLQAMDELLPRASAGDNSYSVVFYFSDGEERRPPAAPPIIDRQTGQVLDDEASEAITSFVELAPDVDGGAVFGYGTTRGAPMLEFTGSDDQLFVTDLTPYVWDYGTGAPAISRLDEGNLVEIADELGVPYRHRREPGGLGTMAAAISDAAPIVSDGSRTTPNRLYWIPSLALFALLLWQAAVSTNEAIAARQVLGGRAKRRRGSTTPTAVPGQAWSRAEKEPAA